MEKSSLVYKLTALVLILLAVTAVIYAKFNGGLAGGDLKAKYSLCQEHKDCVIISNEGEDCLNAVHKQYAAKAIEKYGALCPKYAKPLATPIEDAASCMENICQVAIPEK
jgi:hypothetical protein